MSSMEKLSTLARMAPRRMHKLVDEADGAPNFALGRLHQIHLRSTKGNKDCWLDDRLAEPLGLVREWRRYVVSVACNSRCRGHLSTRELSDS